VEVDNSGDREIHLNVPDDHSMNALTISFHNKKNNTNY